MSPSCRSRRSVGMVIRMLVGAPYAAPRRMVNPPGPMLVMGAFNRGRIALICFSFMARTSVSDLLPTSRIDYRRWYRQDLLRSQPSLSNHGVCHRRRVLRSLVHEGLAAL